MRSRLLVLAAFSVVLASAADAAGIMPLDVPADAQGPTLTGVVWSPCAVPPQHLETGGAALPGLRDCPIVGDNLPLVVISHGRGGSFFGHHDIAETLADAGFVATTPTWTSSGGPTLSRSWRPSGSSTDVSRRRLPQSNARIIWAEAPVGSSCMTAGDLVPFPLCSAIKRGAAFDRFADLGEDRARSLDERDLVLPDLLKNSLMNSTVRCSPAQRRFKPIEELPLALP